MKTFVVGFQRDLPPGAGTARYCAVDQNVQTAGLFDNAVNQLHHRWIDRSKKVKSVVGELGESGININLFVWADAPKKSYVVSDVLNCVYETLNQNGIEIPFPQQDVHIKQE